MKKLILLFVIGISASLNAQTSPKEHYERMMTELKNFVVDTSAVPEDALTGAIRNLRKTKGGFNIHEAMVLKIREEKEKKAVKKEEAEQLETFFASGNGAKWLENAVIRIYRNLFTLAEINEMTAFYSTSAGKKMSESFPLVMMESMKAAETILEGVKKKK